MFHLISPPRSLARSLSPGSPACVTWTSALPAGSCSLTACTVCPAGSRTRKTQELKNIKKKQREIRNGVAGRIGRSPFTVGPGLKSLPRSWTSPGGHPPAEPPTPRLGCVSLLPSGEARHRGDLKWWGFFHIRLALTRGSGVGKTCQAVPFLWITLTPQPPVTCPSQTHSHLPPLPCPQIPFLWHGTAYFSVICIKCNYPEALPSSPALKLLLSLSYFPLCPYFIELVPQTNDTQDTKNCRMSAIILLLSLAGRSNWKQSCEAWRAERIVLYAGIWTYWRWTVLIIDWSYSPQFKWSF